MVRIERLTAGFDWEMAVLRPSLAAVPNDRLDDLGRRLLAVSPAATSGREGRYLEQRSGIMRCFDEVVERTTESLRLAHALCVEDKLWLAPLGCFPTVRWTCGCHIHIGTIHSFADRQRPANALAPYIPVFMALMANSPFGGGRLGGYKSYRVHECKWELGTLEPIDLATAVYGAWGDLSSDRGKPTLELRVADSAGSPRVVAEYTALAAAFVAHLGGTDEVAQSRDELTATMLEAIENRHAAARHGLQATFTMAGREIGAADVLTDMLERAEPELHRFGADAGALSLLRAMAAKRQTQSDMLLTLAGAHDDAVCYAESCIRVLRQPTAFETWLEHAPSLPLVAAVPREERLWERIGERSSMASLRHGVSWPPAQIEHLLARWLDEGRITVEHDAFDGPVYSRVVTAAQPRGELAEVAQA